MVQEYTRPSSIEEALAARAANPASRFLAGGTFLLAGDRREKPEAVIDIGRLVPAAVERRGELLSVGAGATFQDLADSDIVPSVFRKAVLTMVNRNVRNRATAGGNLAAGKSCATLAPLALAFEARIHFSELVNGAVNAGSMAAAEWMAAPRGLLTAIEFPLGPKAHPARAAYGRYARTSCDLSVLTVAVVMAGGPGPVSGLRIAMGGLGPRARRFPELEELFEGKSLPQKADIEALARPLFSPRADWRGSAGYKALRAASLLADALHDAEETR
jgi:putative selenate reductase FAD-binding subunit